MEETSVIPLQGESEEAQGKPMRFLFWQLPAKVDKPAHTAHAKPLARVASGKPQNTYEKLIEGAHKFDKIFNIPLGYVLAGANVLGFMDVLSNGKVLGNVPNLFYIWLAVMGLGVELQFFLIIGRLPDISMSLTSRNVKWIFWVFNILFLGLLGYTSIVIGAVFVQHVDVGGSMSASMSTLGININWFVYQRAALATCLIALMAIDRAMERWRMQLGHVASAPDVQVTPVQAPDEQQLPPVSTPQPLQGFDLEKFLTAMQAMNQQNLQAMQQGLNVTLEQVTKVTIEAVRETVGQVVEALPTAYAVPQLPAPTAQEANVGQTLDEKPNHPEQQPTQEPDKPNVPGQHNSAKKRFYGDEIEALYLENKAITPDEIVVCLGCSKSTAQTWLARVKPME